MDIHQQIAVLESLSRVDAKVKIIVEELGTRSAKRAEIESERSSLKQRIERDKKSIAELEKTRGDLHGEARHLGQQSERSREKLNRTRNEREAMAAQREVEELRRIQRDRENEISKIEEFLVAARESLQASETRLAELDAPAGEAAVVADDSEALEQERISLVKERESLQAQLPAQLFRRYESILAKRSSGLTRTTVEGTCQACHMAIPPMMLQKLRRMEGFDQCPSCRRIVYFADNGTPSEATEA